MTTIREKAAQILEQSQVVVLTSVNKEGYPRPVPMSKIKSEDISCIWFATGLDSVKTQDFLANAKSGVCFQENGNSIALTGTVEVITDSKVKKELWQDWLITHFPQGPTDPNYVLLKFKGEHATYWINGEFIHQGL